MYKKRTPEPKLFAIRIGPDLGPLKTIWVRSTGKSGTCLTRVASQSRLFNHRMAGVHFNEVQSRCHEHCEIVQVLEAA